VHVVAPKMAIQLTSAIPEDALNAEITGTLNHVAFSKGKAKHVLGVKIMSILIKIAQTNHQDMSLTRIRRIKILMIPITNQRKQIKDKIKIKIEVTNPL
jgi:hypothetical protein